MLSQALYFALDQFLKQTHQQLLHTLVILIDYIKIGILRPNDTENRLSSKMNYCLKQALSVLGWMDRPGSEAAEHRERIKINLNLPTRRSRESSPLELDISDIGTVVGLCL